MKDVINLNTYKMQKQYQNAGTFNINLALDNVKQTKVNRDIRNSMIKGYMQMLSNIK